MPGLTPADVDSRSAHRRFFRLGGALHFDLERAAKWLQQHDRVQELAGGPAVMPPFAVWHRYRAERHDQEQVLARRLLKCLTRLSGMAGANAGTVARAYLMYWIVRAATGTSMLSFDCAVFSLTVVGPSGTATKNLNALMQLKEEHLESINEREAARRA